MKNEFNQDILEKIKKKKFNKTNVLCKNSICKDDTELKVFLFSNGLKEQKCHICDLTNIWNKKKLEMIINRKVLKNNNELNNLEILCPNCFIQKNPEGLFKKNDRVQCPDCLRYFKSTVKKVKVGLNKDMNLKPSRCKICSQRKLVESVDSFNSFELVKQFDSAESHNMNIKVI